MSTRRLALPRIEYLESRRLLSAVLPDFGVYHDGNIELDYGRTGATNVAFAQGAPGSQAVAGDFNGDTLTDTATFLNGTWSIDLSNTGAVTKTVQFGAPGDIAVAGDVFGIGSAALGVYDPATGVWQFSEHDDGHVDLTVQDAPGGVPILADYNNLGHDELVLYRAGTWTVRNTDGTLVKTFQLGGNPGDVPVMADVNGVDHVAPGIFNAGTWEFDTNRDGTFDTTYTYGAAGDEPLVGYFNPANSIFVAPGGTGNGTLGHPLGTIAAAIADAGTNSIIRIAAGDYNENLYMYGKTGVTFFGAGMDATVLDTTTEDPQGLVDGLVLDHNTDTSVYNLDLASAGRGLVLVGGDLYLRGVSTVGSANVGVLGTGYTDFTGSIDARHCHFNGMTIGDALSLQNECTLVAHGCTFDDNGTSPSDAGNYHLGRGLIVQSDCTAIVDNCDLSGNNAIGLIADNQTSVKVHHSSMSYNKVFDGALIVDQSRAVFRYDTFDDNGPVRSVADGANGLEIGNGYDGPGVIVKYDDFVYNTSSGIFIGNGTGILIANDIFNNNMVGININGVYNATISTIPIDTNATIIDNTFEVPPGSTDVVGIYALGSGAGSTVGGATASANLFENFPQYLTIYITNYGYSPAGNYGNPTMQILTNYFMNCPDPVTLATT